MIKLVFNDNEVIAEREDFALQSFVTPDSKFGINLLLCGNLVTRKFFTNKETYKKEKERLKKMIDISEIPSYKRNFWKLEWIINNIFRRKNDIAKKV